MQWFEALEKSLPVNDLVLLEMLWVYLMILTYYFILEKSPSLQMENLHRKSVTIKLLEETLQDTGVDKDVLDKTLKHRH